ncbi:hypothetical protein [Dyella silvatica]|uniref:hypothetical protein n=1 Tax=Dyella silvatica TaxID=2992128 RepID=UPI00225998C1|nr:hypothetical protein [Dyella silvatica]
MNANLKRTMIALAVATLFSTSMAYARDGEHNTSVEINKKVSLHSRTNIKADMDIDANIRVNAVGVALVDGTQSIHDNDTHNHDVTNTAAISGNAGQSSQGNLGANIAAGDNNAQNNAGAIAATDASFAFGGSGGDQGNNSDCNGRCGRGDPQAGGMADAESFARQSGQDNVIHNHGTVDSASIGDNAFENAKGNVGVNVASGDNNEQQNSLSASSATNSVYSTATATTNQSSHDNTVHNDPVELGYTDLWQFTRHGLTETVTYSYAQTTNSATMSGNAFANAQGNVGVNIASGTGNLQANSMSMAVATASQ